MNRTSAIVILLVGFFLLAFSVETCWGQSTANGKTRKVPLNLVLPKAMFKGTPVPMNEPNISKGRAKGEERHVVKVPYGSVNLALKKPVTSNESLPVVGDLEMVTDGDKSGEDGHNVDIGFGKKWVQIDLGTASTLSVIAMWHYHGQARAYRDIIVEVANDEDFVKSKVIYNNDHDNSYGKGIGKDMGWVETSEGKVIYCPKNTVARYVRLHSQGNTSNDQNHYVEVEVYGRRGGAASSSATTKRPASHRGPLKIEYPGAMFRVSSVPVRDANVASTSELLPGRGKAIIVSGDTTNMALKKPVTSNKLRPATGKLAMVTDGDKSGQNGHNVDLGDGLKWVQIDLQSVSSISAISLWHYHTSARVYRDVIVRVSNDPDFVKYATVFNNDHDDSSGLGAGKDKGYVDCSYGRLIGCVGTVGRYVRLYSKGSNADTNNHYVEVEIYGRPLKGMSVITKPAKAKAPTESKGK